MQIVNDYPPNIAQIREVFDLKGFNPVFCYGSTLYNPTGLEISEHLMEHEKTHEQQQKGMAIEVWWYKYLNDPYFRLDMEAEAYHNQYQFVKKYLGRSISRQLLKDLAKNLASKLYGNVIGKKEAEELIKHYPNN